MVNIITIREKLIVSLLRLFMAVKLHDKNNQALIDCSDNFLKVLNEISETNAWLSVKNSEDRIFINDELLVYSREYSGILNNFIEFLDKRNIGEILLTASDELNHDEILKFAEITNQSGKEDDAVGWISKKFVKARIKWVELYEKHEGKGQTKDRIVQGRPDQSRVNINELKKQKGQRMYARAIASLSGIAKTMSGKRITGIRKAQRLIQNMVDYITDEESVLMGMSTIRDYDDYTYYHSVNVSIIAMGMGLHMGLPRDMIETLGICGLFHDLGKVDIPIKMISKTGPLSATERKTIEKHSVYSVNKILKLHASRELKHKIMIPPFEHHMRYDLSGYPKMESKKKISFLGRVLSIADVFDALTSPRSYRNVAYSPDKALAIMVKESGRSFDPVLLKIFINMLGVYPIGTLLKFDTGELGLVSGRKTGTAGDRPDVVLISKDPIGYKKNEEISLEECDPSTGKFKRNIIKTYHPSQFGIQAAKYI